MKRLFTSDFFVIFSVFVISINQTYAIAPTANTVPANRVTFLSAKFNSVINANYQNTTVSFEYGLTTSYGNTITLGSLATGSSPVFKDTIVTGLLPGKIYHYRVKAVSAGGTGYGNDLKIITGGGLSISGDTHKMAIDVEGIVYTWGDNSDGQLGDNTTTDSKIPIKVLKGAYNGTTYLGDNPSNPIIAVAAGYRHSLALAADGTVFSFGDNSTGQLGDGSSTSSGIPVRVLSGYYNGSTYLGDNSSNPIVAIAAGAYHSMALAADGTVYTFGYNNYYALGIGGTGGWALYFSTPKRVVKGDYNGSTYLGDNTANPIISIASHGYNNKTLAADGTVYSFGDNGNGQLGDNSTYFGSSTPVHTLKGAYSGTTYLGDNNSNPIIAIHVSVEFGLALAADGTVYGMGSNSNGALGDNTTTQRTIPVLVLKGAYNGSTYLGDNSSNPIIGISGGYWHSIAVASNGTVFTFGYNANGQLGDNTTTQRTTPVKALKGAYPGNSYLGDSSTNPIITLTCGDDNSMTLASDGIVYTFGNNFFGDLGDNSTTERHTPIRVYGVGALGPLDLIDCKANVSTSTSVCYGDSTNIGVSSVSGCTYSWTSNPSGFSSTSANPKVSPTVTTKYYLTQTTTYLSCTKTDSVIVTVNNPTITGTTPSSRCDAGTVTLGATASAGTINWYAAATGGSSLGSGTSFTTPNISATTTYYVDATANSCTTSSRTAITATVNTTPTITGTTPSSRCDAGTVTLGATASAGTINWYAASTGGSSLGNGTSFTTPNISSTTTYYVNATANSCTTSSRTAITATVNNSPTITGTTPSSRCDAGTVTLGASSSAGTINWYAAATGGSSLGNGTSFTTPSISTTTTYYVDATANSCTTSSRTAITATVNTTPTITGITPSSRCDAGTVTLGAASSAGTINWYAASTGGSSLGSGNSFTTPSISATTTYYVNATANSCTSSSRTAITATVNNSPTITGTTPASRCDAGTVTLGATASAGTINWYAAATGGSSLGNGTSFTTPNISSTTTYYVDATANGCNTSSRTAITATVNNPTITGTTPSSRCDAGTVTLGATASAGTINWYAAAIGGSSLGNGTSFTTPNISATTTYYVDATANGCTTLSRTAITATVNTTPTITGTTPSSRCDAGIVTLGAASSAGTINWYAAATGGSSLGSGNSFTTPSISATTTYYVNATANGCNTSSRTAITATVNTTPTITGTTPSSRCDAGTVTLGAASSAGTINWYAAATGGSSLGNGTSFTTPNISSTTTYYVDVTGIGCNTSSRTAITATVKIKPIAIATSVGSTVICQGERIQINANSDTGITYQWLYNNNPISSATNISYYAKIAGDYRVLVTNGNGCYDTSKVVSIIVNPVPTVGIITGPQAGLQANVSYSYNINLQPNHTYQWIISNGIAIGSTSQNSVTVKWMSNLTGKLTAIITNAYGCADSSSIAVTVGGGVGIPTIYSNNNFTIYPNPTENHLSIIRKGVNSELTDIKIIDVLGNEVLESIYPINASEYLLNISELKVGAYILYIHQKNEIIRIRFIKE